MLNNENNIQNVNTRTENKIIVGSLKWEQLSWWLAVTYWENSRLLLTRTLLASVRTHGIFWWVLSVQFDIQPDKIIK